MSDLFERLRKERALTPELRREIEEQYGERGRKALLAVDEDRVKCYRDFFVVVGRSDEYVVEEDFCICNDFLFRGGTCSHILAVRIAEAIGKFESYSLWYCDCWKNRLR
jgi:predicted nucleic acid-binding Zn finger protein